MDEALEIGVFVRVGEGNFKSGLEILGGELRFFSFVTLILDS